MNTLHKAEETETYVRNQREQPECTAVVLSMALHSDNLFRRNRPAKLAVRLQQSLATNGISTQSVVVTCCALTLHSVSMSKCSAEYCVIYFD